MKGTNLYTHQFIRNVCEKNFSGAKDSLVKVLNEKIKERIRNCNALKAPSKERSI